MYFNEFPPVMSLNGQVANQYMLSRCVIAAEVCQVKFCTMYSFIIDITISAIGKSHIAVCAVASESNYLLLYIS